ncbi:MAG: S8 family serine peptidase, partial [Leptonema sp. (in: bacteria)]
QSWYSERGANLWVCAPSNGLPSESGITTTDIRGSYGYSPYDYTDDFGGTSSATPYISGVVAFMLSTNPNLTYRDIRYILAKTARKVDPTDTDWTTNAGGFSINHKYGFGVVDTFAAVNLSKTFSSLGGYNSLIIYESPNNTTNTIAVSDSGISKIEFVEVNVNFSSTNFGNTNITLQSPSGTQAKLVETHQCDPSCASYSYKTWRFGVSRFLDETPIGNFVLTVTSGTLHYWSIKIYGR